MIHILGLRIDNILNYPCDWELLQSRHNDVIIRGTLYQWNNNPSRGSLTWVHYAKNKKKYNYNSVYISMTIFT